MLGEGKSPLHPNDDVNKSQSSNDTFPTAVDCRLQNAVGSYLAGLAETQGYPGC
ncbi:MAG: lyase family protein [Bacteroidales bacterium]